MSHLTWFGYLCCAIALISAYMTSRNFRVLFDNIILRVGYDFYRLGIPSQLLVLSFFLVFGFNSFFDGSTTGLIAIRLFCIAGWLYGIVEPLLQNGKSIKVD